MFDMDLARQISQNDFDPRFMQKLQQFLHYHSRSSAFDIVPMDDEECKGLKSRVSASAINMFRELQDSRDKMQSNQTARSPVKSNDQFAENKKSLDVIDSPFLSRSSSGTPISNSSAKQTDFKDVSSDEAHSDDSGDGLSCYGETFNYTTTCFL